MKNLLTRRHTGEPVFSFNETTKSFVLNKCLFRYFAPDNLDSIFILEALKKISPIEGLPADFSFLGTDGPAREIIALPLMQCLREVCWHLPPVYKSL